MPVTADRDRMLGAPLTLRDVAAQLGVHTNTVYRLAERGRIRFVRVGRTYRFRQAWIDDFIDKQGRR